MTAWHVYLDIAFVRRLEGYSRAYLKRLEQIQRLLELEGPDGLGVTPIDAPWSEVERPVERMAIAPFDREFYFIRLEIQPGGNIVIRDASRFDRPQT